MRAIRASQSIVLAWALTLGVVTSAAGQAELTKAEMPQTSATGAAELTKAEKQQFLLTAEVTRGSRSSKGVTRPWRLTLSNGTLTHDASFQPIDERKSMKKFDKARSELNFVDSYHYNIAAYGIAELLGLDSMMPVTVERQWDGKTGSLTWWVENVMMDEGERLKKKTRPPDTDRWNKQFYRMRVFSQLVSDSDRNLTNVLITEDWTVWMIDFSRAFRLWPELPSEKDLTRCDRQLFERVKGLTEAAVQEKTRDHLSESEIEAVMARRDKMVEHFNRLIAERGEATVLF